MVNNLPQPANTNDSRQRFEDAKKRYAEMNSNRNVAETTQDAGSEDKTLYNNIIDFLKDRQEHIAVPKPVINTQAFRPVKFDNDNIPIPLPVKDLGDQAIASQQYQTNRLLGSINDNIISSSIHEPLKIDDSEIAHEATLKEVVTVLQSIAENLKDFAQTFVEKFTAVGQNFMAGFGQYGDSVTEERGWLSDKIANMIDYIKGTSPKVETAIDTMAKLFTPVTKFSKQTANYLKEIYELQLKRMQKAKTDEARAMVDDEAMPKGALAGLMHVLLPKDSVIRKVFDNIAAITKFFGRVGEAADQKLQSSGVGSLLFSPAAIRPLITGALRLITAFGGMGTFLGGIIGAAAFAPFYAMFKHPEQLYGYLEAFGNLFTKAIGPALEWISKEIVPPLALAMAGLMAAADYLLDNFGTFVNEKLTYLIGTVLPDVLVFFGKQIDTLWQGLKEVTKRIAGIFGFGEYSKNSILYNILAAFGTLADSTLELMSIWVTEVIKSLGLSDFFGLKEGEGIYGRIKRFFMEDIPNFAIKMFDKMMKLIDEYNPIPIIKKKIKSFTDMIIDMIPTWNDMKKWVIDAIPAWVSDSVRQWIVDQLGPDPEPTVPGPNGPMKQEDFGALRNELSQMTSTPMPANKLYDAPISAWDRGAGAAPMIFNAPTTHNNSSTSVSQRGGGSGLRPTTTPSASPLDGILYGR